MEAVFNYTYPSIAYNEVSYPSGVDSVISDLDIQLLKWEINSIEIRILNETVDKIYELGILEENWDSYGGAPISNKAIAKARSFIANIAMDSCLTLTSSIVSPEPSGGVLLKWKKNNNEFLAWFMPGLGQYTYLEVLSNNRTGDKVRSQKRLLEKFKEWWGSVEERKNTCRSSSVSSGKR